MFGVIALVKNAWRHTAVASAFTESGISECHPSSASAAVVVSAQDVDICFWTPWSAQCFRTPIF